MSGRRDESLLLDDMVDAVRRLIELHSEVRPGTLGVDRGTSEMVQWNLLVLGEASKRLHTGTRARFADVDWSAIARTRDRLVHHYEGIAWPVIGEIITDELPDLLPRLIEIRDVLRDEFDAAR